MDETLLNDVVAAAIKAGADAAEAVGAQRRSLSIGVRNGALEEVEREESRDLGLRVFVGQRQATVSGSDISAEARDQVRRALDLAAEYCEPGEENCGLPRLYVKATPDSPFGKLRPLLTAANDAGLQIGLASNE